MDQSRSTNQNGGRWKNPVPKHTFSPEARDGANAWIHEVKALQLRTSMTFKEALSEASARRKDRIPMYMTVNERYIANLDAKRDQTKIKHGSKENTLYRYSGRKNKRPLTMPAAERILLKYYRDRSNRYKNPLSAMRKNIASCHKDPKRTLYACQSDEKKMPIMTQQCANSWKFRPGKYSKSPTGPGYYDIHGLNDLCGTENAKTRKESKLYNMSYMRKKVQNV